MVRNGFGVVAAGACVAVRHPHHAQPDLGDLEFAELRGTQVLAPYRSST
jgi:hypothetical protein